MGSMIRGGTHTFMMKSRWKGHCGVHLRVGGMGYYWWSCNYKIYIVDERGMVT